MRPNKFTLNNNHHWANGLKLAWIGNLAGGARSYDSVCGIPGNAVGNVVWTPPDQAINRPAQIFDGTGDWVSLKTELSYFAFIQKTLQFTVSTWIKLSSTTARSVICGNSVTWTVPGFFFLFETYGSGYGYQALRLVVTDGTGAGISFPISAITDDNVITDTNWHHVFVSVEPTGTVKFILDGKLLNTNYLGYHSPRLGTSNCTYNMLIGAANHSTPSLPFNGKLADIMIWNRTLCENDAILLAQKYTDICGLINGQNRSYRWAATIEDPGSESIIPILMNQYRFRRA